MHSPTLSAFAGVFDDTTAALPLSCSTGLVSTAETDDWRAEFD